MNRQLVAQACGKMAEAFALLEQGLSLPENEDVATEGATSAAAPTQAATPAKKAAKPLAETEPAKKARKSAAAKAAPVVEETEDDEQDEDGEEESGDEESHDDLDGIDEEETEAPAKVTREALRKDLVAYAKKNGKTKAYALLEKYGAKNTEQLKEKDLEKVSAILKKGL